MNQDESNLLERIGKLGRRVNSVERAIAITVAAVPAYFMLDWGEKWLSKWIAALLAFIVWLAVSSLGMHMQERL